MKDYIIVGFGFAGCSLVHLLEKHQKSFVVFSDDPTPVTTVAGAMFNPYHSQTVYPCMRVEEQMALLLPFFGEIEHKLATSFIYKTRVFRKFTSVEEKNNWFCSLDKPILSIPLFRGTQ